MATNNSLNYYPQPRYNNRSLGISYVGAYDPAVDQQMLGMMQREYGKAFSANQALAEEQARQGEIYSRDIAGREQRMGEFKDSIGSIKEHYNNDLALAAPELARTVAKERQNPWYQKNKVYTQEYDRRQKLLDQFGPNIIFTKDLPQGNLNEMEMDDIGFEYLNRAHLDQRNKEMFGALGDKITDLGVIQDPQDPRFIREGQRKGLTTTEINQLVEEQGPDYVNQMIDNMGLTDTPSNRAMLLSEFSTWANSNLVGGEKYNRMIDPAYTQSLKDAASGTGGVQANPQLGPTDQRPTVDPNFGPKAQTSAVLNMGIDNPNSPEVQFLDKVVSEQKDEELQNSWNKLKTLTSGINIPFAPGEAVPEIRNALLNRVFDRTWFKHGRAGNKDAYTDIRDVLIDTGVVTEERIGDLNYSETFYHTPDGNTFTEDQLREAIPEDLIGLYKELDRIPKNQIEQLGDLYNPGTSVHAAFAPIGENAAQINQSLQELVKSSALGTKSTTELLATGAKSYNDKGKKQSDNKTETFLKSWRETTGQGLQSYTSSVLPGTGAAPPRLLVKGSDGKSLEIPLQREATPLLEAGYSGNILQEIATTYDVPSLVDTDVNYVAGQMFRKSNKRSMELSELLGGSAEGKNLGTIKKEDNGIYSYTVPGTSSPMAKAASPAELLRQISPRFTKIDDYYQTLVNKYSTPKQKQAGAAAAARQLY